MKELEEVQSWEGMDVGAGMPTELAALYNRMMKQIHGLKSRNGAVFEQSFSTLDRELMVHTKTSP